jgi:hypothetical protein
MTKLFNRTPKPAMLRSVQNERWNVSGALAELLDNSFGPGRGNATAVTIFHDLTARTLTVLDNGRGMDAIGRLFQHGNSIGHSIGDIGEYGAGGTKALLWLAARVSIWTLREQMVQHDNVIWKNWFNLDSFDDANVSNDWHRANILNTPPELLAIGHGTLIRMHLLPTRSLRVNKIVRDLARFYSTGLRKGGTFPGWRVARGDRRTSPSLLIRSQDLRNTVGRLLSICTLSIAVNICLSMAG